MFKLSSKYISNVFIVIKFLRDSNIRSKQSEIERAYERIFSIQSINTNTPDNDVPIKPRIIFNDKKKQLMVSQESSQLTLRFDSGVPQSNQFETVKKYITLMVQGTSEFIDKDSLLETSLVAIMNYPSKESSQCLNSYIFSNFIKAKQLGSIESASFKVAYKTDDSLFVNIEISTYEIRKGEIKPKIEQQYINLIDLPVVETGLQVKLDINNRPQIGSVLPGSSDLIVSRFESLVLNEINNYLTVE